MGTVERIRQWKTGAGPQRGGMGTFEMVCDESPEGIVCKPPNIWADDRIFFAWHRSHMANERTFLSWSRTCISLLAFGFVIQRFELFMNSVISPGAVIGRSTSQGMIYFCFFCFGMAAIAAIVFCWRFLAVRRRLNWGMASYSFVPDALVVVSVMAIIIVTLALMFPRLVGIGGA
jgi:putative membrane protein